MFVRDSSGQRKRGNFFQGGASGNFEVRGLRPGDYYALAVDRYDPIEMTTAHYLRGMVSRATSVRLEEDATAALELRLVR